MLQTTSMFHGSTGCFFLVFASPNFHVFDPSRKAQTKKKDHVQEPMFRNWLSKNQKDPIPTEKEAKVAHIEGFG